MTAEAREEIDSPPISSLVTERIRRRSGRPPTTCPSTCDRWSAATTPRPRKPSQRNYELAYHDALQEIDHQKQMMAIATQALREIANMHGVPMAAKQLANKALPCVG